MKRQYYKTVLSIIVLDGIIMKRILLMFLLVSTMFFPTIVAVRAIVSTSPSAFPSLDTLFGAGAKWAANGGTKVAYVDFYDNLIAHPNPSFAGGDPNYFLPMKNGVLSILEGEGFTVDTFADIPANLSQYNLVFLEAYWACTPANEPAIRDYISNGGGVVLKSGVVTYLAHYSATQYNSQDLSSIASWFGASHYINAGGAAYVSVANPVGTSLNVGDRLATGMGDGCAGITSMSADSQVLATWQGGGTFAFTHQYGQGRVYYQVMQTADLPPYSPQPGSPPSNTPPPVSGQVYYSVEPVAVAPLVNVNASINGLETPPNPPPVGQDFTVEIHLRNATAVNVPAGVAGVEVHFDFSNILNYSTPIGFTNMIGQPGGVLTGDILYGINPGFYESDSGPAVAGGPPYKNAKFFEVAAATDGTWNSVDGVVASITFQITSQPPAGQADFCAQLPITYADLTDTNSNSPPFNIIPATLHIDSDPAVAAAVTAGSLNLKSLGGCAADYIQLAQGLTVTDINTSSLMLNGTVAVDPSAKSTIGIFANNGASPALMVEFNRTELVNLAVSNGVTFGNVTLFLTGKLLCGTSVAGTCQVQVSSLMGDVDCDGKVGLSDLSMLARAYGSTPGSPRWNANADINGHGKVDLSDLCTVAVCYGQHYP